MVMSLDGNEGMGVLWCVCVCVCGQGRGRGTHAYTHSLEFDHHVFMNLRTGK